MMKLLEQSCAEDTWIGKEYCIFIAVRLYIKLSTSWRAVSVLIDWFDWSVFTACQLLVDYLMLGG